jgi:multiple sugar transport system substrate-binding protein
MLPAKKAFSSFVVLSILFSITGLLFSCTSREPEHVSVALFQAPSSQFLIELIPEFERATGTKVEYDILPYADLKTKVEQQFFAKSGTYDVVMADCIWIPSFAVRGYLQKLDEKAWDPDSYSFDDLLPALQDYLGRYPKDGVRYGMPFMSNTHMMAYRPELIKDTVTALGIKMPGDTPDKAWTWEEYYKVAKAVREKAKTGGVDLYGSSLQARAGAWIVYEWYSVLFGFETDRAARDTGLPPFGEPTVQAMDYYAKLYRDTAPAEALTWGHEEETSAMCSGRTAMDATSNVELASNLLKPECQNQTMGKLAFAYPPVGPLGIGSPDMGGYGLLLSAQSKNPTKASAFILWAASKDVHSRIVKKGGSPIRISEVNDPTVLANFPYLKMYPRLIADSIYRARIPDWPELQDIISRELVAVMKGEKSATDATAVVRAWKQSRSTTQ